jgi:hypothetical protein
MSRLSDNVVGLSIVSPPFHPSAKQFPSVHNPKHPYLQVVDKRRETRNALEREEGRNESDGPDPTVDVFVVVTQPKVDRPHADHKAYVHADAQPPNPQVTKAVKGAAVG